MRYMKTEKRFKPYTFYSHENFKKYREATIKKRDSHYMAHFSDIAEATIL